MPPYRNFALVAAVALSATSLTISAAVASYGSSSRLGGPTLHTSTPSGVPPANAPHAGQVSGVRYGNDISINNQRSVHAFRLLHRELIARDAGRAGLDLPTIHPSVGTSFDANTVGAQATQSVSTKIEPARGDTTLYTPTMYPSGGSTPGSCIEMSTAYFHSSQVVSAWDWCQAITFVAEVTINKSFIDTYTRHHNYSTQIVQTRASNNTWTSYLYNYKTDVWEQFFSQNGTSQLAGIQGWDVYELYSELDRSGQSYACADLEDRRIEAKAIMVGVGGTLVRADDTNAGQAYDHPPADFHCDTFSYSMIRRLSHWKAIG